MPMIIRDTTRLSGMLCTSNEKAILLLGINIALSDTLIPGNFEREHFSVLRRMAKWHKLDVLWIEIQKLTDKNAYILDIVIGFMEGGIGQGTEVPAGEALRGIWLNAR